MPLVRVRRLSVGRRPNPLGKGREPGGGVTSGGVASSDPKTRRPLQLGAYLAVTPNNFVYPHI